MLTLLILAHEIIILSFKFQNLFLLPIFLLFDLTPHTHLSSSFIFLLLYLPSYSSITTSTPLWFAAVHHTKSHSLSLSAHTTTPFHCESSCLSAPINHKFSSWETLNSKNHLKSARSSSPKLWAMLGYVSLIWEGLLFLSSTVVWLVVLLFYRVIFFWEKKNYREVRWIIK